VYLHVSTDFDFDKYFKAADSPKPNLLLCPLTRMSTTFGVPDRDTIHAFNWPHSCTKNVAEKISIGDLKSGIMDVAYFQDLIQSHPYETETYFKTQASIDGKSFKDSALHRMILNHRQLKFPSDENTVLNTSYCKTIDANLEDKQDLYQGRGEILDSKAKIQKYVILATKFSLRILSKTKAWYADGTFKVSPRLYKQVYIILANYEGLNIPCVFIIMTGKCETLYEAALSHLRIICRANGHSIILESVMLDFEDAARNAFRFAFGEKTKLRDCYFHYCKALWKQAHKKGLCKENLLNDTILLLAFLKLIIHIGKDLRIEYFLDVKECFLKKNQTYKEFLLYFEKNWLNTAFINFNSLDKEEINDRTNNVCESFNNILNQHVGRKKPPLAMFISKLRELEFYYRQKMMQKIIAGAPAVIIQEPTEDKLPFSLIYHKLKIREEQLKELRYDLRSGKLEGEFITSISKLSEDCYNYVFSMKSLIDEPEEDLLELEDHFSHQSSTTKRYITLFFLLL